MVKKLLSAVLALSMMTASLSAFTTVSAETAQITVSAEVIRPGYALESNYTAPADTAVAYQWQKAESNDEAAEWADIEGATGATYTILNADGGKYLRLKVTEGTAVKYSAAVLSGQPLGITATNYKVDISNYSDYAYNPADYIATISGETKKHQISSDTTQNVVGTFSLLDTITNKDGEKEFFVLMAYRLGVAQFSGDGNSKFKFDPTVEHNLGWWMNTTEAGVGMLQGVNMQSCASTTDGTVSSTWTATGRQASF